MTETTSAPATTDVTTSPAPSSADSAAEQVSAASESSSQETKELEVVHDGAPVPIEGETIEEPGESETEGEGTDELANKSEENADETKEETKPQEETKKRGRDARIRELVNNERKYKEIIKSLNPDYDIDKALEGGRSEADARMDAFEHDKARDELAHEVNQLNTNLQQQSEDLVADYPFMDSKNEARTQEEADTANLIMDLWFEAAKPEFLTDKDGKTIMSDGDPVFKSVGIPLYDFVDRLMKIGDARVAAATAAAETNGQRNAEKKLAAVEIPAGSAPRTDRSEDKALSAAEYAKKHGLKTVQ